MYTPPVIVRPRDNAPLRYEIVGLRPAWCPTCYDEGELWTWGDGRESAVCCSTCVPGAFERLKDYLAARGHWAVPDNGAPA